MDGKVDPEACTASTSTFLYPDSEGKKKNYTLCGNPYTKGSGLPSITCVYSTISAMSPGTFWPYCISKLVWAPTQKLKPGFCSVDLIPK